MYPAFVRASRGRPRLGVDDLVLLSSVSLSGVLVDEADLLAGESRFRHLLLGSRFPLA